MADEWDEVMRSDSDSDCIFGLSGDLKYMLTMLGHAGASSTYPCTCCVRSRKTLCYRSWIAAEQLKILEIEPVGKSQLRSYPADPNCKHDVEGGTCFCVDKGAEHIQEYIDTVHEDISADFKATDQNAPWHKDVMKLTRENTYSILAEPLLKHISISMRFPGIWHCCHNTRQMLWLMLKDVAAVYGIIPALQAAMKAIGLDHIQVAAAKKPRKECNMEAMITEENAAAQKKAIDEEAKTDCAKTAGMDGKELVIVMANLKVIIGYFESAVKPEFQKPLERWAPSVTAALAAFDEAAAIALADMWETNRAAEMGEKFRTFADEIANISKGSGLPYVSREYLAILPIHWLCEPDHLQAQASTLYESWGVAPGSGTDATTEMVSISLFLAIYGYVSFTTVMTVV